MIISSTIDFNRNIYFVKNAPSSNKMCNFAQFFAQLFF